MTELFARKEPNQKDLILCRVSYLCWNRPFLEEAGFQIETVLTEILRPDRKSSAAFGRVFGIHVIRSHLSLLLDFKSFLPNAFS